MQQLRCEEGGDPRPVFAQLARLRSEYATASSVLSNEQYKVFIFGILPMSFRPTIRTVQASVQAAGTVLTLTALINAITEILCDEAALNSGDLSSPMAMAVCGGSIKCYNCNKKGHTKAECWSKGGGCEGQGPWRRKRGKGKGKDSRDRSESSRNSSNHLMSEHVRSAVAPNVPSASNESLSAYTFWDEAAYTVATDFSKLPMPLDCNVRLIDSAASHHFNLCPTNFTSFREIDPIPIQSADGRVFYATDEGDIQIVLSNGTKVPEVLTLQNVLYAPRCPFRLSPSDAL